MFQAYAAFKAKEILKEHKLASLELRPSEVLIKVSHCGICHSDLHLIDNDWGFSKYPLVPGHEIVGIVEKRGSKVRKLKKGNRVGVGWQRSSCGHCEACLSQRENLCAKNEGTCITSNGGFAEYVKIDERFALSIPEKISSAEAAPLFCAGITVYSPLRRAMKSGAKKIGVVGIGGLGHLAIQFAAKMGAEVVAFSHTPKKEAECRELGAAHFVDVSVKSKEKPSFGLDFILSTSFAGVQLEKMFAHLGLDAELCFVGVPNEPLLLRVDQLLNGRKKVSGSLIGSPSEIKEMLDFAAKHGVRPMIELSPFSKILKAIERVREGKVRYRMVLEW